MKHSLENLNILILSHYFAYGPTHDLEHYLRNKVRNLTIIEIPLYLRFDLSIKVRHYDNEYTQKYSEMNIVIPTPVLGSLCRKKHITIESVVRLTQYLTVLIDRLVGKLHYDITIAEDPITAFLAIILRKLGKVKYVIFQSHAYNVPERNSVYRFIDYYVTRNSDVVWALSRRLAKLRKELGAKYVIHTPVCIRDDIIDYIHKCCLEKENTVVYVGALNEDKGADVLLKLIPSLIKIFDKVYVIGEGQYGKAFKKLSELLKDKVIYLGRLPLKQSMQIIKKSLLGLVLTKPSFELLTTDPMKPKVYIASHTPLVIPKYLELSYFVRKFLAGIVISNFDKNYIMKCIMESVKQLDDFVEGAISMARHFNYWRCSTILGNVIEKTLYFLEIR